MSFWDFSRGAASARLMVEFGRDRGADPGRLLSGTKLGTGDLDDPDRELSADQELRIAANLLRTLGGPPGLGIELGMRYHISTYGIWGYGLICSETVRDAMTLSLRYLPLTYVFTDIRYREDRNFGELCFDAPQLAGDVTDFLVQRDMAASATLMREVQGPVFRLSRFALKTGRTPQSQRLAALVLGNFGVPVEFGAKSNSLAFDRSLMERPLPQANSLTVAMCEQSCRRLLERRRTRCGTVAMIRQFLDAAPGGSSHHLESIARLLNTSDRTLKRRLRDEGTTFRTLLAERRAAMAEELLRDGSLSITEIAERLGFADLSTFSQAFKRWFGVSPRNFALAARAGAPAAIG
ncbi:MAG: AraC family transcriptional regulator [Gemmatimonadales bacterium]|nr:AraC family transcriptional regulator [Gemmatimonadales bacterium]